MSRKQKPRAGRGRRKFLKALPSTAVACKWITDKLGGYLVGALAGALLTEARRFFARPGEPTTAKRHHVLDAKPGEFHVTGSAVSIGVATCSAVPSTGSAVSLTGSSYLKIG